MRMSRRSWENLKLNENFWSGNLKERGHLEDIDVDGKITLK
jgi:hypothetical protein